MVTLARCAGADDRRISENGKTTWPLTPGAIAREYEDNSIRFSP
jgi:hypothetical protein